MKKIHKPKFIRLFLEVFAGLSFFGLGFGVHYLLQKEPLTTKGAIFLSDKEVNILYESTKHFVHFLEKNNITYWAVGGTLIGALRNHPPGPMRWDDDADFAIFSDQESLLVEAMSNDQEYLKTFINITSGFGYQYKLQKYENDPAKKKDYNLDVFVYHPEGSEFYIQNKLWRSFSIENKSDILPVRRCQFWDFEMNCPQQLTQPMNGYGGYKVLKEAKMWSHHFSMDEVVQLNSHVNDALLVPMLTPDLLHRLEFSRTSRPQYNFKELDEK